MATRSRAAKKSGISVDFSNTETSGVLEEGDYLVEVDEVEDKESSTGNPMLVFTFKVTEGEGKGRKLFHNCSLQPQALFNLRAVLEALGNEVPQGVLELDPSDLIGQTCGVSVNHEQYEGKTKARIAEFFDASELGEATETEPEAPTKPAAKPAPKASAPEPEAKPAASKKKKAEPEEPTFAVGDLVSFTDDDGDELSGKVTEITGDTASVKVGKEIWELDLSDLTKG